LTGPCVTYSEGWVGTATRLEKGLAGKLEAAKREKLQDSRGTDFWCGASRLVPADARCPDPDAGGDSARRFKKKARGWGRLFCISGASLLLTMAPLRLA